MSLHAGPLAGLAPALRQPGAVRIFGVTLVGVSVSTGVKLLFTAGLIVTVLLLRGAALAVAREFPYPWDEIALPISYDADPAAAEQILLAAARAPAITGDPAARRALASMQDRYAMADASLDPAVYWRITDNWLDLSLLFLVPNLCEMQSILFWTWRTRWA